MRQELGALTKKDMSSNPLCGKSSVSRCTFYLRGVVERSALDAAPLNYAPDGAAVGQPNQVNMVPPDTVALVQAAQVLQVGQHHLQLLQVGQHSHQHLHTGKLQLAPGPAHVWR